MAAVRPTVKVQGAPQHKQIPLPAVFQAPIRLDVVQFVHSNLSRNRRQPYAVFSAAGHQSSAESWGTGRAVSRIPRVAGGGTHRSGQGAFGNMCRGGRMFAPTKVYRRWHRKVNVNQRRFAMASALAASALPSLVLARGHKIDQIPEIPFVIADARFQGLEKTKNAVALLKEFGAHQDVEHVKDSKKIRAGKGKMRNRRYVQRRGPLVIFEEKGKFTRAFRNIPGVETVAVSRLNLLSLAPGGHLGRFVIWTESAFAALNKHFGDYNSPATLKHQYRLPRAKLTNPDIHRIINSDEIQSKLRPAGPSRRGKRPMKKNPLRNKKFMEFLNPYSAQAKIEASKKHAPSAKGAERKKIRQNSQKFKKMLLSSE